MSGVCLDLITNPLMYNMVELGTRGGISMVTKKHSKANHKHLEGYDDTKDEKHIMYLDPNNLYGWAMSQPLPYGFMHFFSEQEIEHFNLSNIKHDGKEGYILEVDLEYPTHLHDHHNCYPLAPEHLLIEDEALSPYSMDLWEKLNKTLEGQKVIPRIKTTKLTPTLKPKTNYVVHYRTLQLYVDLGMKVTKIHRIIGFQQQPWLKPYIQFNANMRKNAKNSVFGKCLENLRERCNISLVNSEDKLKKKVSKPSFMRCQIFNDDLVGVQNKQINLLLNKPIYVGQTILDLSKLLMYQFHYKVMKPKYGGKINLLFTDTDSLCYEICTKDVYKDMEAMQDLFDTSNYNTENVLFSNKNKKVPGKFKDELGGVPIKEFIGLRPKMYSLTYDSIRILETGENIYTNEEKKSSQRDIKM